MSRRAAAPSRTILPDPKFNSEMLAKFMNVVMHSGKKSAAEHILYGAVERISEKTGRQGAEALELVVRYRPHVALVDLFIGEESGAEVCERLRAAEPATRVLLFSGAGEISPNAARAAGASGFAYKDWPARRIASAVRMVGLGNTVFERHDRQPALGLSERERAVLELMASGATNPEIGEALHLSRHTVKEHSSAVYRKLEVRNRTEAVQRAQRLGLLR